MGENRPLLARTSAGDTYPVPAVSVWPEQVEHYSDGDDIVCVAARLLVRHVICACGIWCAAYLLALLSMAEPLLHAPALFYHGLVWAGALSCGLGAYRALRLVTTNTRVVPSEYRRIIKSMSSVYTTRGRESNGAGLLIDFKSLPLMRKLILWCLLALLAAVGALVSSAAWSALLRSGRSFSLGEVWLCLLPVALAWFLPMAGLSLSRSVSLWTVLAWALVGVEAVLYFDKACGDGGRARVPGVGLAGARLWAQCRGGGGGLDPRSLAAHWNSPWLLMLSPLLVMQYILYARLLLAAYRSQWGVGPLRLTAGQVVCGTGYLAALVLGLSVQVRFIGLTRRYEADDDSGVDAGADAAVARGVLWGWAASVLLFGLSAAAALSWEAEALLRSGGYKTPDVLVEGSGGRGWAVHARRQTTHLLLGTLALAEPPAPESAPAFYRGTKVGARGGRRRRSGAALEADMGGGHASVFAVSTFSSACNSPCGSDDGSGDGSNGADDRLRCGGYGTISGAGAGTRAPNAVEFIV